MSRKREEAIAAGIHVNDIQHTMKRRTPSHNYCDKGTYMLTLVVDGRMPLFGTLKGNVRLPLSGPLKGDERMPLSGPLKGDELVPSAAADAPRVVLSPLGEAIRDREIAKISAVYPMVEVWKLCIMPDHLHIIVRVKEKLPEGKHLGHVVSGFMTGCTRAWWALVEEGKMPPFGKPKGTEGSASAPAGSASAWALGASVPSGSVSSGPGSALGAGGSASPLGASVPPGSASPLGVSVPPGSASPLGASVPAGSPAGGASAAPRPSLFEKGYNDKILLRPGQLDNWKRYLDDNPRRLAIKRQCPDYFTIMQHITIGEWSCQMVGNRFLLTVPDRAAVIVHRADSDQEFAQKKARWLALGEMGGVLVSAAIATREKEVMREAMDRGYRLILLRENGFPPLYKPAGESFMACSEGRLLQISPWEYHMQRKTISREQCLILNRLAEEIAGENYDDLGG
jgi:hypothetical protein